MPLTLNHDDQLAHRDEVNTFTQDQTISTNLYVTGGTIISDDLVLNRSGWDNSIVLGTTPNGENRNVVFQKTGGGPINGNWTFRGNVAKPDMHGFNVGPSGTVAIGYPDTLQIFTSVKYDNGNNYNTSTGRFTVPVNGYYLVFFGGTCYSSADNYYLTFFIQRNGSPDPQVGRSRDCTIGGSGNKYVSCGLSKVAYYNAGDYIELWSYDSNAGGQIHPEFTWGMTYLG